MPAYPIASTRSPSICRSRGRPRPTRGDLVACRGRTGLGLHRLAQPPTVASRPAARSATCATAQRATNSGMSTSTAANGPTTLHRAAISSPTPRNRDRRRPARCSGRGGPAPRPAYARRPATAPPLGERVSDDVHASAAPRTGRLLREDVASGSRPPAHGDEYVAGEIADREIMPASNACWAADSTASHPDPVQAPTSPAPTGPRRTMAARVAEERGSTRELPGTQQRSRALETNSSRPRTATLRDHWMPPNGARMSITAATVTTAPTYSRAADESRSNRSPPYRQKAWERG